MFKTADIQAEYRRQARGRGVAGYDQLSTFGRRDAEGDGVEPHMAKLRRENNKRFALADVANDRPGRHSTLQWR